MTKGFSVFSSFPATFVNWPTTLLFVITDPRSSSSPESGSTISRAVIKFRKRLEYPTYFSYLHHILCNNVALQLICYQ
ncbi:hypothetical protein ACFX13_005657 [Malus domestica]